MEKLPIEYCFLLFVYGTWKQLVRRKELEKYSFMMKKLLEFQFFMAWRDYVPELDGARNVTINFQSRIKG